MSRFFKVGLSIFFSLIIVFGFIAAVGAKEEANKGVVCVYVETIDGKGLGYGSGFVVGEYEPFEYIATAWHLVNPVYYDLPANHTLLIYIWSSKDDRIPAGVHVSLPETGIALLKIDPGHRLHGYEAPEISDTALSAGDSVYAVGFPDGDVSDLTGAYAEDIEVISGSVSKVASWNEADVYECDLQINRGNSGGPMLNEDFQVVGINNYYMLQNDDISGAVFIKYLIDVLDRRGIDYAKADYEEDTEEDEFVFSLDEPYVLYGGIGLGGLLLLIIILSAVKKSRKKNAPSPAPVQPQKKSAPKPIVPKSDMSEASPKGAPGSPGAPLANASNAAVTMAKRPADKDDGSATAVSGAQSKPIILGISGYFAGDRVDLENRQIIIGRDPRLSHLVYPLENEVISRKHCSVYYDENSKQFILEDSSSNGTFFAANERLEPGKPYYLKPGARFYLADPEETFELRVD